MTNASANETETTKLTQATYDRLVAELEDLTTRGRVEIAQAIEAARALGDLSRERRLPRRQGRPGEDGVPDPPAPGDAQDGRGRRRGGRRRRVHVATGSTVTLRYEGDDEDERSSSSWAPSRSARATCPWSPPARRSGQALIGRSAGDTVEYKAPAACSGSRSSAVDR